MVCKRLTKQNLSMRKIRKSKEERREMSEISFLRKSKHGVGFEVRIT